MQECPNKFINFYIKESWDAYLNDMKQTSTFGDHLTLYAAYLVFQVRFLILDANNENCCLRVRDTDSENENGELVRPMLEGFCHIGEKLCVLGYYPELKGSHYVSLGAASKDCLFDIAKRVYDSKVRTPVMQHHEPNAVSVSDSHAKQSLRNDTSTNVAEQNKLQSSENATKQECEDLPTTTKHTCHTISESEEERKPSCTPTAPTGVKLASWLEWTKSRPWLITESGSFLQSMSKHGRQELSDEFIRRQRRIRIYENRCSGRNRQEITEEIDKHSKGSRHQACDLTMKKQAEEAARKAFAVQSSGFEELNAYMIAVTENVFRAYLCATENLAFATHPRIIECHKLNGSDMGTLLFSPVTCHDIITHIAKEMKMELINKIIKSGTYFSVMATVGYQPSAL
jgi:hypothetical protein